MLLAGLVMVATSLAAAPVVRAALAHPPAPHPDAAPPGASVRVDGWPELDPHCPSAAMWLARDPGIGLLSDPRLMALQGTVTIEKGLGQASAGPLVDVPVFTFTAPSVAAGPYLLYYSCPGSTTGWDSLFEGAPFTVLAAMPGTDLPRTSADPQLVAAVVTTTGILLVAGAAALLWRRRRV
jgi:hypothetical protein